MKITDVTHCTGCRACEQLCPSKCISIAMDNDGFLYPTIDEKKCIQCGLCARRCPSNTYATDVKTKKSSVYAVKLKDKQKLLESSSGGAFTAIAEYVLEKGGAVFGCVYDKDLTARHIRICKKENLELLKGSKYVQSDTGNTFTVAKGLLEKGIYVLYTGTPCQIAGLKAFLKKDYTNLLTVDLICHGVPSPIFFKKYISWIEKHYNGKVLSFIFRDKAKGGWGFTSSVKIKKGKKIKTKTFIPDQSPYYNLFLSGSIYRICCYKCLYASPNREGDFTIGDFWGIENSHPGFLSDGGVSLLMVNSKKARSVFSNLQKWLFYIEATFEEASAENLQLLYPTKMNNMREVYLSASRKGNFESVVSLWKKYYWRQYAYATLKQALPTCLKRPYKLLKSTLRK